MTTVSCVILTELLFKRITDPSSLARKAALQALGAAVCSHYVQPTGEVMKNFKRGCLDPMLSARKLSVQLVTDVLLVCCCPSTFYLVSSFN